MKKIYLKPNASLAEETLQLTICTASLNLSGTTSDIDDLLSRRRRYDVWDEEDEEEE